MPKDKKSDLQKQIDNRELSSHIQIQIEQESRNLFKNETTRRKAMSAGGRKIAILAVILLALFLLSIVLIPTALPTVDGGMHLPSLRQWRTEIMIHFSDLFSLTIASSWRLAAFAAMVIVGMAMTTAGAVYQGIFQNPMASPTTLGVQAGGMLGGLVYILFFLDGFTLSFYAEHLHGSIMVIQSSEYFDYLDSITQGQKFGLQIWEVFGCFLGVALVVGISLLAGRGKISTVALMLAGSVFSVVVNEFGQTVQYIILYNKPEEMEDVRIFLISQLLGGSSGIDSNIMQIDEFLWMAIPISVCLIAVFALRGKLNIMMFGAEEARAMGVPIQAYRLIFIVFCTLLCAVVLSFCGQVSMLGFIIPHLARFMVGPDFKTLVPASALLGGITTLLIWDFCSLMGDLGSFNLYTGVVCGVLSLIFMLFYRRQRHANWS